MAKTSPVNNNDNDVDVYYFPNQTLDSTAAWSDYRETETFYSITVQDPNNQIYSAKELNELAKYVVTGGNSSITVKQLPSEMAEAGYSWNVEGQEPTETVDNGDGTTTYSFTNVTEGVTLSLYKDGLVTIIYDLNIQYQAVDTDNGNPTVGGKEYYTMVEDLRLEGAQTTHTVLSPSKTSYNSDQAGQWLTIVTFGGWDLYVDGQYIQSFTDVGQINAGTQKIDLADYENATLELRARWTTKQTGNQDTHGSTVNFYVNLRGLPMGR